MPLRCHDWLKTLTGFNKEFKDGLFGIEIETETLTDSDYPRGFLGSTSPDGPHVKWKTPLKWWKAINDGSLRNFGVEFVLNGPLSYDDTRLALHEFEQHLGEVNFIKDSPSTSVHVHINMLGLSMTQIVNFVMLYSYFENLLIEFSGPTRRSNLFALPLRNCDRSLSAFIRAVVAYNAGACDQFPSDENAWKYSSLNFCPISKHGSFEIRCFRGTTDTKLIWTWINILHKLYEAAKQYNSPTDVLDAIRRDRGGLLEVVFKSYATHLRFPDFHEMLSSNIIYPVLISSSVRDWTKFEDAVERLVIAESQTKTEVKAQRPWEEVPFLINPGNCSVTTTDAQEIMMNQWCDEALAELMKEYE